MKKSLILSLLLCSAVFIAAVPSVLHAEEEKKADSELSADEQNKLALEAYELILELSASGERKDILQQLENAYYGVISKYPKANLAQEAYWRLIQIYLGEYHPPAIEKAERVREEFVRKYPDSKMKMVIDRSVVDWYLKNAKWDKITAFFAPAIRKSIETGKYNIYEIMMYTEAKYNLGDMTEAEKGYKIINANFPSTKEGARARQRIEEIGKQKATKQ
jgi:outer membrane protein assembly factor BamD (BamD/ComL family)